MASSKHPGSHAAPFDGFIVPPRTPASLGINDHADPNLTSLLGDTVGPTGVSDWANPGLCFSKTPTSVSGLACFAPYSPVLAVGFDLANQFNTLTQTLIDQFSAALTYIPLEKAQDIALRITTYFEGGKSMNYQALSGDFDGQGTSFGLIQWNFGSGTLGPLLQKMLNKDEVAFEACFNDDADYSTLKKAIEAANKADQLAWARDKLEVSHSKKWKAWHSAFSSIGSNEAFNLIQHDEAIAHYHPRAIAVIKHVRNIASALFINVELRSYCAIYDLCVQQNGIDKAIKRIKDRVAGEKPATQNELMKIVVTERAAISKNRWVSDCLSRRMGILSGSSYKSTEHEVTSERKNPQFSLLTDIGAHYVSNL